MRAVNLLKLIEEIEGAGSSDFGKRLADIWLNAKSNVELDALLADAGKMEKSDLQKAYADAKDVTKDLTLEPDSAIAKQVASTSSSIEALLGKA